MFCFCFVYNNEEKHFPVSLLCETLKQNQKYLQFKNSYQRKWLSFNLKKNCCRINLTFYYLLPTQEKLKKKFSSVI